MVTKRAARFVRRPVVISFMLSLRRRAQMCQVSVRVYQDRSGERVLSVKRRCHAQLCQVRLPPGQVMEGALVLDLIQRIVNLMV